MRKSEHGHITSAATEADKQIRRAGIQKDSRDAIRRKNRNALVGKCVVVVFEGHGERPGVVVSHDSGNKYYVKWKSEDTVDKYTTTLPRADFSKRPTFSTVAIAGRPGLCDWQMG